MLANGVRAKRRRCCLALSSGSNSQIGRHAPSRRFCFFHTRGEAGTSSAGSASAVSQIVPNEGGGASSVRGFFHASFAATRRAASDPMNAN